MNLEKLLALFTAFDDYGVDYAVTGHLASLFRGCATLTEGLEIAVADVDRTLSAIVVVWPGTEIVHAASVVRVLPPDTPFYIDVVARSIAAVESLSVRGVLVRVAPADDRSEVRDAWSRSGFTLRERLAALHELTRELVPPHVLSGVKKYRSIEQAEAERQRWDGERADRLRAERLRK